MERLDLCSSVLVSYWTLEIIPAQKRRAAFCRSNTRTKAASTSSLAYRIAQPAAASAPRSPRVAVPRRRGIVRSAKPLFADRAAPTSSQTPLASTAAMSDTEEDDWDDAPEDEEEDAAVSEPEEEEDDDDDAEEEAGASVT